MKRRPKHALHNPSSSESHEALQSLEHWAIERLTGRSPWDAFADAVFVQSRIDAFEGDDLVEFARRMWADDESIAKAFKRAVEQGMSSAEVFDQLSQAFDLGWTVDEVMRTILRGANLRGANLRGADLQEMILRGADLHGSDLNGLALDHAILDGANLSGANLSSASFQFTMFQSANLYAANLRGADLYGANLSRANLSAATLSAADLNGANLSGASLYSADLIDAKLWGADLRGADLRGADLRGANLWSADLRGADLHGANLSDILFFRASRDESDPAIPGWRLLKGRLVSDEWPVS